MTHWRAKALAFRALTLPGGEALHLLMQRHFTRTWPRSSKTLDALWGIGERILRDCAMFGSAEGTPRIFEVGAGRDLAVPLALRQLGARSVSASDVARLARLDLVQHAARHMAAKAGAPVPRLESWADLARAGVDYRAPEVIDASFSDAHMFDCTCSNEVLEHVPAQALPGLLRGLNAVTKPGGITTHSIDYSDHYARSDARVSRFNFLRFNDREWVKYNSGRQYVNRLRHCDYVRLFREAGFTIVHESTVMGEPTPEVRMGLAPQFRKYSEYDLFALRGRIVARQPD